MPGKGKRTPAIAKNGIGRSSRLSPMERGRKPVHSVAHTTLPRPRAVFSLIWGVLIRFLLICVVGYLVYRGRFVWVTVLVSSLLALVLYPSVNYLSRPPLWGMTRPARRTLAALVLFVFLGLALYWTYYLLVAPFIADSASLYGSLERAVMGWKGLVENVRTIYFRLPQGAQDAIRGLDLSNITNGVPRFLTSIVETSAQWLVILVDLVLIPVLAFYFIVEARGLKREFLALVPPRWRRDAVSIARSTGRILRDYTIANLILCLLAGVVVYIALRLLHVPYALSLAVLAGLTRFIPVVGPILGGIPIVLISLTQGYSVGVATLLFFVTLHLVESKFLLPKLIGDRLHMHGAVVLVALLLGGEFAGIPGMFIAAPTAALLRVLLRTYLLRSRRYRTEEV